VSHASIDSRRPVIGITTYGRVEKNFRTPLYASLLGSPEPYVESVRRAGGIPVLLPSCIRGWDEVLQALDGVVMTGGADLNPQTYGGDASHPTLTSLDDERDTTELDLIRSLVEFKQVPALCICRGFELINVAFGGTLHEDIADLPSDILHRESDGGWVEHEIEVAAESRLSEAMQAPRVTTYSGHHQAIRETAECFDITARAPDGVIEGIEHRTHPWIVGVQWHPEKTTHQDPSQQGLFDALVRNTRQC
jgi:putative glutamine amidotransferase